jgi:hypothetical protein
MLAELSANFFIKTKLNLYNRGIKHVVPQSILCGPLIDLTPNLERGAAQCLKLFSF